MTTHETTELTPEDLELIARTTEKIARAKTIDEVMAILTQAYCTRETRIESESREQTGGEHA